MKSFIKKSLCLFILLSLLILIPGCKKRDKYKITVSEVAHSVFYAPQYVALTEGYFEEEGLEVDLVLGNGANNVMASLLSGDAQIGLAGAEATIYIYNQGQKDYAVNFCQLTQKDGNFLVGRTKEENFDWNSLKGKTILGGRQGGMPVMVLEYALKQKGLLVGQDDKSVIAKDGVNVRTDVQFAALAGAFTSGEGDYVTLFEPTATLTEKANEGYILASLGEQTGLIPYTNYFCNKSYLQDNEDVIQKFTNAIYKGVQYVYSHTPEEVAKAIHPYFTSSTIEELTIVMERYLSIEAWAKSPVLNEEAYELFLDIMEEANELDKRTPYDKIVVTKYALETLNSNLNVD